MRSVYRVLAFLVAAGVVVQVAAIAYQFFRMGGWVEEGGTFDKGALENGGYPGEGGGNVHGIGAIVVALLAILLLVSSFFAKVPGGRKWALIVFGLTVLQWALAFLAFSVPALGFLHGVNALFLFGCAVMAGMRVNRAVVAQSDNPVTAAA
jgi:hypothetical protein